ncbi:MAG: beta-lactamase family protein [Oscillospiraceae bacterium]|nr:beta-lactamase family protein [Oscillospiraceae bacterium]
MNQLEERLQPLFRKRFNPEVSSVSYAIMVGGEIIAKDSFGKNEKHAGTYNIGSISKVYTTVAVMQLVEKGLVDLDTPVCEYLPKFKMADERYKKITVRHCLNHASGLPGSQFRMLSETTPRRHYYEDVYRYLEHAVLHNDPGLFCVYCNDGFTLAEMVVSALTGEEFSAYCRDHITEPIGASSTRQPTCKNTDYPHTAIVGHPDEDMGAEGAGGLRTTMEDLCKFGQQFLGESAIISEASKAEMGKRQGIPFFGDFFEESLLYGLGWDCVEYTHSEYDLGEHVLVKGGGTVQFGSRLIVIPKYDAVLAISATVDCKGGVEDTVLALFARAMADRGVNIYKNYETIPEDWKRFEGVYVTAGKMLEAKFDGAFASVNMVSLDGKSVPAYPEMGNCKGEFAVQPGHGITFRTLNGVDYLMGVTHGVPATLGIKAEQLTFEALPESWKQLFGKKYIIRNLLVDDLIGAQVYNGVNFVPVERFPDAVGVSIASAQLEHPAPAMEYLMTPYVNGELRENVIVGKLQLPYMASRDQISMWFYEENGVSYMEASGYTYQEVSTLEAYEGQAFAEVTEVDGINQTYVLGEKLETLPEIPEGRRLVIFNDTLSIVYDSLFSKEYKPVETGYIALI